MAEIIDVHVYYDVNKNSAYIITGVESKDSNKIDKDHPELVNNGKVFFELEEIVSYVAEKLNVDPDIVELDEPTSD